MIKKFEIIIGGKFCPVPHPERVITIDLKDTDESFTDKDMFVVIHEVLYEMKRTTSYAKPVIAAAAMDRRLDRYHLSEYKNEKLSDIKINISGFYCEDKNPNREIIVNTKGNTIDQFDIMIILFETLCNLRNHLDMTSEQMDEFACRFNIHNFGMRKGESPFVARGKEDGVQKFMQ